MTTEFKPFDKILHIGKLYMNITQKIHGSNAQILIEKVSGELIPAEFGFQDYNVFAGSRTRWLNPDDDNYGFCKWVMENRQELIEKLGEGRHFGEWAGPGINTGEGLKEKTLCLFNWRRWEGKELPNRVTTVPLLYRGRLSLNIINDVMERLKERGSYLVPRYMKPEGIVVDIDGQLYKNVFNAEEIKWKDNEKPIRERGSKASIDVSYLFQPLRLEKLLSTDEKYIREYPSSLGSICKDYVLDLEAENQFKATNEDELKAEKKALGKEIYYFVKSIMSTMI